MKLDMDQIKHEIDQIRDEIDEKKHPEKKPLISDLMTLLFSSVSSFYFILDSNVTFDFESSIGYILLGFSIGWLLHLSLKMKKSGN